MLTIVNMNYQTLRVLVRLNFVGIYLVFVQYNEKSNIHILSKNKNLYTIEKNLN